MDYIRPNENYNNCSCSSGISLGESLLSQRLSLFKKAKSQIFIIINVIIRLGEPQQKRFLDSLQLTHIERQDPNSRLRLHPRSNRRAKHQTHKHREE